MTIGWHFDNTYSRLPNTFKEDIKPTPVHDPELVVLNEELAKKLNLDFSKIDKKKLAEIFSGNTLPKNTNTIAQAYAGHQFGHFTMLGDGRAVLLGEHLVNKNSRFDIQFKGSGRTSFSRGGDGRAALGPMLREYIISEAIHSLNIQTTRSLAVVKTGEKVVRENLLQGAILTRVASSHIRVGTFQYIAGKQNIEELKMLVNYTIDRHFPEITSSQNKALDLLNLVLQKQCELIVDWMRVGFIHGVMNTDNMSLSGETIDYGPAAYLDEYNPKKVFSSIDKMGRYSFENQSKITLWNLARFAETFLHLIDSNDKTAIKKIEDILNKYKKLFDQSWLIMMSMKLNLDTNNNNEEIVKEFLDLMHIYKLDYTNTFLDLENNTLDKKIFKNWEEKYKNNKIRKFKNVNPQIIPRNHIIEEIINEVYSNNYSQLYEFEKLLKNPYEKIENKKYITPPLESEKVFETFCGT